MKKIFLSLFVLPFALLASHPVAGEAPDPKTDNKAEEQTTADPKKEPADYLEIYQEFSGRCMGLRRGDMRMVRNTHPSKVIEYRMVRLLGGHRQASLIQGTITPEDEGQKLGCELLDDRKQTWEIVRARFVESDSATTN